MRWTRSSWSWSTIHFLGKSESEFGKSESDMDKSGSDFINLNQIWPNLIQIWAFFCWTLLTMEGKSESDFPFHGQQMVPWSTIEKISGLFFDVNFSVTCLNRGGEIRVWFEPQKGSKRGVSDVINGKLMVMINNSFWGKIWIRIHQIWIRSG